MIRPAERFAVNITHDEPALRLSRPSRWSSLPMLIALAAVLGAGIGGMLPSGWGPATSAQLAAVAPGEAGPAAIEPAAGPGAPLLVPRAPDQHFYASVLLDRIPVTMQLEPAVPETRLSPGDAGRLSVGGAASSVVQVAEVDLGRRAARPGAAAGRAARRCRIRPGRGHSRPLGGRLGRRWAAEPEPALRPGLPRAPLRPMLGRWT